MYNIQAVFYQTPTIRSGPIFNEAIKEFNELIRDRGLTAARDVVQRFLGTRYFVAKIWQSEDYFFSRLLRAILIEGSLHYLTEEQERNLSTTHIQSNTDEGYVLRQTPAPDEDPYLNKTVLGNTIRDWIDYGVECIDCGTPFIPDTPNIKECPSCVLSYTPRAYNHRVERDLGLEETKEVRFGVELEYEDVTGKQVMQTLRGHALPKRDGSIDSGVEIVTRPACIDTHKKQLSSFFAAVKVQARSNTGMHVHIERSKLSQYQIGFIMEFLNSSDNLHQNQIVAGRQYGTNHYTQARKEHTMTNGVFFDTDRKKLSRHATNKYSALNTNKEHTVEVRIFSSPVTHEECSAKLDFVAALVKYSSPYSVSVKSLKEKLSYPLFLAFVQANRKDYPDFHNYYIKTNKLQEVSL